MPFADKKLDVEVDKSKKLNLCQDVNLLGCFIISLIYLSVLYFELDSESISFKLAVISTLT